MGEKLRIDLQKRNTLPSNKSSLLMAKFDEVRSTGGLLPSAALGGGGMDTGHDDVDQE